MATVALEGMRFFACHGYYEEEQVLGNEFVVEVFVTTTFTIVSITDELYKELSRDKSGKKKKVEDIYNTVNYETLYLICDNVMRQQYKLLETVAEHIAMDIRHQFKNIQELKVRVKKLNPPLGGRVEAAWVEVDGQYSKRCARCERPLLCYGDNTCWCMDTQVFRKTLEQLKTHYGDQCLCRECLEFFAGVEERTVPTLPAKG